MKTKPIKYKRFEIGTTIIGWEVTDADGRPVTDELDYNAARHVRDELNTAVASGSKSLAVALGAIDEFEDFAVA